ncbi:MAG: RIP metalloprotease RseP [Myxococcales bacterium]|nr:RIP metalloprotease RseP [Myxococcales bacterium]
MSGPQQAIVFIIFLGVLVTVHELGHFLAAKWAGVKVVKFSIGFGPRIFGFKRGETEYQVAWVPLGGYVKMHGDYPGEEHDLDDPDRARGLYAAPWWKRAIIMAAGPAFNLIFPVFAYFFALLGETTYLTPRVGGVAPDMPAAIAGIKPGDLITRVNGVEIVRFEEISDAIAGATSAIPISVKRGEQELTFQLDPVVTVDESNPIEKTRRGMLGISAQASAPVLGVPAGSIAEQAGLRTFDRIMSINGQPTGDEVQLNQVLEKLSGALTLQIVRLESGTVGGASFTTPKISTFTLEKQPGEGYAALGAEGSDLYIGSVLPGSAADTAGLKRGDRFVSVNDAVVKSYFLYNIKLKAQEDRPFKLTWQSGPELKTAQVQRKQEISYDDFKNERKTLVFGTSPFFSLVADPTPAETKTIYVGPQQAIVLAVKEVPKAIRTITLVIVKLFTGGVPLDAVGGPIAVFQVATKSAEAGLDTYLMNMALVSVNLGLVNLLPIPIFDGFALLAAFWEGIRRRPIPLRVREYANMFGLVVIAMLLVLVFKNDITKLFR